ncbi:MAG: PKD domain-containing protein [Thermoplasmata archaeon]
MTVKGRKEARGIARLGSAIALISALLLSCLALFSPQATAETHIYGFIEETHWTVSGSPYIVVEDAYLSSNRTLLIDPGVEIRFNEGASLFVWGSLIADALGGESINFTSNLTAKHPGDWGSIFLAGHENVFRNTRIEYAHRGIVLHEGASVTLEHTQIVSNQFAGIYSQNSSVDVSDSVIAENSEFGVYLRNTTGLFESCVVETNGISFFAVGSSPIVTNSTVSGDLFDVVLTEDSRPRWIGSSINKSKTNIEDEFSSLLVEWFVTVNVRDLYSAPVSEAEVLFSSGLGANRTFWTDESGSVGNVIVTEAELMLTETISHNPHLIRASSGGHVAEVEEVVEGNMLVELSFSADLHPPSANAGGNEDVDEDVLFTLDASGSTDNDPDFLSTGDFIWEFDDRGSTVRLEGLTASYVFETPGSYGVTLTARDSSGNEDTDAVKIVVRDRTPPVSDAGGFRKADVGDSVLFDAGNSSDNDPRFWSTARFVWFIELGDESIELHGERVHFTFEKAGNYSVTLSVRDYEGNADSDTFHVQVKAPAHEFPLVIPMTLGLLAAAFVGGLLNTEMGKFGLFKFLVIPLYVKLKRKDILDHFLRGQIYGYIKVHPGENYTTIKRNLQLNNGTLTYHLDVLEREGLIVSKPKGSRKVFYPVGMKIPDNGAGLHVIQEDILERVSESPGLSISDLARLMGISRQLTNYHVKKLVKDGRITIERKGVRARCFSSQGRTR